MKTVAPASSKEVTACLKWSVVSSFLEGMRLYRTPGEGTEPASHLPSEKRSPVPSLWRKEETGSK
ncbi:hypothetical protein VL12_11575 [Rossellomorea marisflavi]|nr:hypothetical protein VL12_11575 [Rossellomorea marisflavi]